MLGSQVPSCYGKCLKKVLEAANSSSMYYLVALQDVGMVLSDQRLRTWAIAFHPAFSFIIPTSSVYF